MNSRQADVHTLTGAYALNALPEDDRERFERHLADCPSCTAEVDEFGEVLARLGTTAEEQPPAQLREQVLDATERIRQLPPIVEPGGTTSAPHRKAKSDRRWRTGAVAVAAAAVVAAVVLGYQAVVTNQRVDELQGAAGSYTKLTRVLAAPDVRVISRSAADGGTMTAIASQQRGVAVVLTSDMPAPPEGHTYQAWVLGPSGARSAGLLNTGNTKHTQLVAHDIKAGNKLGLTVEPEGGSPQPTTKPLMLIPL